MVALASLASSLEVKARQDIPVIHLLKPSIRKSQQVSHVKQADPSTTWMDPIVQYLQHGVLPRGHKESSKLRQRTTRYILIDDQFYRRSYLRPTMAGSLPTPSLPFISYLAQFKFKSNQNRTVGVPSLIYTHFTSLPHFLSWFLR